MARGALLFSLWACVPSYVVVSPLPDVDPHLLKRMAVFLVVNDQRLDSTGPVMKTGQVEEHGEDVVAALVFDKLQSFHNIDLILHDEVESIEQKILEAEPEMKSTLFKRALQIGKNLEVATVLTGRVNTFVDRVGDAYGIESPASVGFELFVVHIKDGEILWKGSYYETQKSLFSNIGGVSLFLKRKGRWQTARELAVYGIEELFSGSPWEDPK